MTESIPLTDKQAAHVAGLEAIIRQKNEKIARLEEQITAGDQSPIVQRRVKKAYRDGWEDAANRMMNLTQRIARDMSTLRHDAFQLVLEGERRERERRKQEEEAG